ncbi:putative CRISPR-associated protein [Geitlerinema sp. PCC 9228]|uniref:putative CRISPR-associated protein n=1 Tax=Geitlerinema sp. PCC 9228 TaxID=111611 RepID=UPI0008F9DA69|nr:putative CRISPR-associated protein [Geitlerinema sp. PCC 9228]
MVTTFICSTGTSAAKILQMKPPQFQQWIEQQNDVEAAAEALFQEFRDLEPSGENLQKKLSAEIHSLVRMKLDSRDRVLLLSSSTDDGYCCALAVAKYLQHHWQVDVTTEKIPELQVKDAEAFRREGVVRFVKRVITEINNYGNDNAILNPTGGFKALVPYTVLIGMLKGVVCRYIFEQSTTVLDLPPLPVEFKRSQFEAYRELFEKIERDTDISKSEWEAQIPYNQRKWFDALIEEIGDRVTLSAIGFLFLDEIRNASTFVPYLSKVALDECFNNLNQLDECNPIQFLERVSRSQEAFRQAEHINLGNGVRWLKPGRTTDRYLVSIEGWQLLVWRAIREDEIGKDYPNQIKVNPNRERRRYAPFVRIDEYLAAQMLK